MNLVLKERKYYRCFRFNLDSLPTILSILIELLRLPTSQHFFFELTSLYRVYRRISPQFADRFFNQIALVWACFNKRSLNGRESISIFDGKQQKKLNPVIYLGEK